jgi:type IV secretory pathway VirB10-like protein
MTDTSPEMPATPASASASMRLRAETPRVTRISRRVLIGLGVVAGLGIGGALIYALQTADRQQRPEELFTTDRRQTADGLQGLPADYSGIPQLGPPLPGDLGGPIVKARDEGKSIPAEFVPAAQPDPEEQRRLAEMEAARTSEIFFQTRSTAATAMPGFQPSLGGSTPGLTSANPEDRQLAFLNAEVDRRTVAPDRVAAPASPFVLQAGSVIPAALITGIRSDLPGQVTAQVTQHIYDSPTGGILLVPQGTRLIGQYDNGVAFGQRRVLLVWTRMIFPNGRSIVLERQPGADTAGYAGLEDGVDYHWWELMQAAGLSTLLAIGTEMTTSDDDRLINAIRSGAGGTIADAGQQIIQRQLQVAPTLTIRPGYPSSCSGVF